MKSLSSTEKQNISKLTSEITKKQWIDMKNNPEKMEIWSEKRRNWMKTNMVKGEDFYNAVCEGLKQHYKDHPERLQLQSENTKKWFNSLSEEEYFLLCEQRKSLLDETRHEKHIQCLTNRYADKEFKTKFTETMTAINKNPEKRKKASIKILENWKNPDFVEKMSRRKKKPTTPYKIYFMDGSVIIVSSLSQWVKNTHGKTLPMIYYKRKVNKLSDWNILTFEKVIV
jgi:hypothetical protein